MKKKYIVLAGVLGLAGILVAPKASALPNPNSALDTSNTVEAYKLNEYGGKISDCQVFLKELSNYQGKYGSWEFIGKSGNKEPLTKDSFTNTDAKVKYWSSHGNDEGIVFGDRTVLTHSAHKANFSWAGGNLEFVIMSACHQLTGDATNPRAKYAKAMIGEKGVRVICGYHIKAPSGKFGQDTKLIKNFLSFAKSGQSVKTAWILANERNGNAGYCVLTHAGEVQNSKLPGFGADNTKRPDSSSTTILRFTKRSPVGKTEQLAVKRIPNYCLKAKALPASLKSQEHAVSDTNMQVKREIETTDLKIGETQAKEIANLALYKEYKGVSVPAFSNASVSVAPIVAAEVEDDATKEVETPVAYSVTYTNQYGGVKIADDSYSAVVDNKGVNFSSLSWKTYQKVPSTKHYLNQYQALSCLARKSIWQKDVEKTDISFVKDKKTGYYKPCWEFQTKEDGNVYVDCATGEVKDQCGESC